jgi:hypothetical protein
MVVETKMTSRMLVALILLLFSFPSWACFELYSQADLKQLDEYQLHDTSGHNVGLLEYNASLDGWVIVDSWHDPHADLYEPQTGDLVWASSTGDDSILLIPASGSGGGGAPTPPGNPPPTIPYGDRFSPRDASGPVTMSCGSALPPKELDDIGVVGTSISIIRSWLSGAGAALAIINGSGGGGSGSDAGSTPETARSTPGEAAECSGEEVVRIAAAGQQIRAAVGALGCVRQIHRGRYWEVDFPGGETGVYRGIGDCRSSINNVEVEAPSC